MKLKYVGNLAHAASKPTFSHLQIRNRLTFDQAQVEIDGQKNMTQNRINIQFPMGAKVDCDIE